MGQNAYQLQVKVETPARGDNQAVLAEFAAAECVLTWSWGLQPANALIDWVSANRTAIPPMADMTIKLVRRADGAVLHTFYGLCRSVAEVTGTSGFSTMQEFVDTRDYLQWDVVYGSFNKRQAKIVNGVYVRRYEHILPVNADLLRKTYTNAPYTAREILDFLFAGPTVESPWTRLYHSALDQPVYDIDCLNGKKLGTAVLEVSEKVGTVFTLMGDRYRLVWTVKGVGTLPAFPATSDARRAGTALSGNPTRLRILGERNVYQVLDMVLEPDWKSGWQNFYDLDYLADDLFQHEVTEASFGTGIPAGTRYNAVAGDASQLIGRQLAGARARTITVGQYANLRDARDTTGSFFRDYRKFAGRSRLQMPAALYIATVLFRAFRPLNTFALLNADGAVVDLYSMELLDRAVVEVTHDPATGAMSWERDVISAGNGYAIVRGYQVGLDAFKTLRPKAFRTADWLASQNIWEHLTFSTDDSGEGSKFILFDQPVIQSSELIQDIVINSVKQDYAGLKAGAAIVAPPVRAALTFAAERFSYVAGEGTRDDVENVNALFAELVTSANGGGCTQMFYADGQTAAQKAAALAAVLLNRQFYYDLGGYLNQAVVGQQLTEMLDRVTLRYNSSGTSEEIDFTNERSRQVSTYGPGPDGRRVVVAHNEPERDFDRRAQLVSLLPGQRELKEEARQMQAIAAGLRSNPRLVQTLLEAFHTSMGLDGMPATVFMDPAFDPGILPALPLGTPLWRQPTSEVVMAHGDAVAPTGSELFVGVTVMDNERAAGPLRATGTGDNGIVLARVKGPVMQGATVGLGGDAVQTYLVSSPNQSVGVVQEEVTGTVTKLVRVRVTGGGSGGAFPVWL